MKQTIEIEVPEGFEAIYDSKTQKIQLINKDNKPKSWEEFCDNNLITKSECWINDHSEIVLCADDVNRDILSDRNCCINIKEAEAFRALMQLRQLRKAWVGNWEPNWCDISSAKHCIISFENKAVTESWMGHSRVMSFPNKEMAEEFLETFKDLIEQAKILL